MKLLNSWFRGKWIVPIVVLLILLIGVLIVWFHHEDNQKLQGIISGLITGFIVLLFQVWLSWQELKKMEKWDELKIIDILHTRDDPNYYRPLIENAREEIKIQGVTCKRFLDDFANGEASAPDRNKVLLKALSTGELKVKVLIAEQSFVGDEEKSKAMAGEARLKELSTAYPGKFFYGIYKHEPRHSIMVIDRESIVGPIFPHVSSKFSPAIRLKSDSKFVDHYKDYFDKEWEQWGVSN